MPKGKAAALKGIFGEMLDDILKVAKKSGHELNPNQVLKGVGDDVAKAEHLVVFKAGSTKNLAGKTDEYVRQLRRQMDGLKSMTADDLLKNLAEVKRGGLAQREAREKFQRQLASDLEDVYRNQGLGRREAKAAAEAEAKKQMSTLAALHEPDIVAGGKDVIGVGSDGLPSMGDKYVNSSIGSQWKARRDALEAFATQLQSSDKGGLPLNIDFLLE
mgnify:CR=1 FL=1